MTKLFTCTCMAKWGSQIKEVAFAAREFQFRWRQGRWFVVPRGAQVADHLSTRYPFMANFR